MVTPVHSLALLAGILLCLRSPVPPPAWAGIVAFAVAVSLLHPRWRAWRCRGLPLALVLLGAALCALHLRHALAVQLPPPLEGQTVALVGTVEDLPHHEARRTRLLLRVDDTPDMPAALRGERVRLAWYDDYDAPPFQPDAPRLALRAGSRWAMHAKLRAPRGLRNPGSLDGERHAVVARLAASGYVRDADRARALAPPAGIVAWRERVSDRIAAALDERPADAGMRPTGSRAPRDASSPVRVGPGAEEVVAPGRARFVQALALGDTRGLGDEDWAMLRALGLTHLIAISGFHVGLVAGGFALLARGLWWLWPGLGLRLPRPIAVACAALLGGMVYAAATGFALPTLRTVLMIAAVAWVRVSRRSGRAVDALALAAAALLLWDPLSALTAGFWLSLAGVAWLLWCMPAAGQRPVRDFLRAQGVATLGLLPLTVALFGQASLAGPLVNLPAIPWWSLVVVPLALVGTLLDTLSAGAGDWAWRAAAWCFEPSWRLFARIGQSDLALVWLAEPSVWALPLALVAAFWCLLPRGVPGKPLALLLWLPLLWPDRQLPARGEAELVVLDVGQGLSVLVRTRSHALLYDMGPAQPDGYDAGERTVAPALRALGVGRLQAAVMSHGDSDHAGGFESVRDEIAMARVYAPEDSGLDARAPDLRECRAGEAWSWDGVRFRFLHPTPHFPYLRNESSCVLRVETVHGAFLLTGDIGEVIERALLHREPQAVRAAVVLVAHHGSGGSSDAGFVAATGARLALVSSGHGNRFRHPLPMVTERWRAHGAAVVDTSTAGAIRVRLAADGRPRWTPERLRRPRAWDAAARRERLLSADADAGASAEPGG